MYTEVGFYIIVMIYIYNTVTENHVMANASFQALVILGLMNLLNKKNQ